MPSPHRARDVYVARRLLSTKCTQWLPVHNRHVLRELSTELSTGRTACRTNTDNPFRRLPIDAHRHAVRQRSRAVAGSECLAAGPFTANTNPLGVSRYQLEG